MIPLGRTIHREVKQVTLLPGFVYNKSSGNCYTLTDGNSFSHCPHIERYPHHVTASPHLPSHAGICHTTCGFTSIIELPLWKFRSINGGRIGMAVVYSGMISNKI
jgi:hypothetical protein